MSDREVLKQWLVGASDEELRQAVTNLSEQRDSLVALVRRHESERDSLVNWLVQTVGYPIDMSTDPPVPTEWRDDIERAWYAIDCIDGGASDVTFDEFRVTIAEEGRWLEESAS